MTNIAFHFGASDKLAYICRLLRKATGNGSKVVVLAELSLATKLDTELWGVSAVDFVPHCMACASASLLRYSPLLLTSDPLANAPFPDTVLLQLSRQVPPNLQLYKRVIEIVGLDESDRLEARQRWRAYAALGLAIEKHDLAQKEAI